VVARVFAERVAPTTPGAHWKLPVRVKVFLCCLGAAILAGSLVRVLRGVDSDFPLHYAFGKRFVEGTLIYAGALHVPYPPFWAMFWAPWTLLSLETAQVIAFLILGVGGLTAFWLVLERIGRRIIQAPDDRLIIALIVALGLAARFILRDLTESGVNLFVWLLVWAGLLGSLGGWRVAGGMLIGFSTALKMTPAIFIPYFLLKREWRTATAALATAAVFSFLPGLFRPPALFWQEMRSWTGNAWHEVSTADASQTILGKPEVRNLSLRAALARLFQRYPAGHPLFVDHPGFIQFLDLSPQGGGWLVRCLMLAFLGLVAWRFRRPASNAGHPMVLPLELATVSALALLYSPITWKQHCVGLLPALFLLSLCSLQWDRVSRWMWAALLYYLVFALALTRDVVGRSTSILLESYHVVTWAILLVVILLLVWHRRLLSLPPISSGALEWSGVFDQSAGARPGSPPQG
jgi:alpha-1,2-mannosyltransferase